MRMLMLLCLLNLVSSFYGYLPLHINLFPLLPPEQPKSKRKLSMDEVGTIPISPLLAPSKPGQMWAIKSSRKPSPSPAFPPEYHGYAPHPSRTHSKRHRKAHHAVSSTPFIAAHTNGCEQTTCTDPQTSTPIGSPCGCVLPIQVKLDLGVTVVMVFPQIQELEIEVAAGTYLIQSQVKIMGANANSQDQGKTVVDIYLVPLGVKFDSPTASLIYERFWKKKVLINTTLFGDYEVIYIQYPGLPSSPPSIAVRHPIPPFSGVVDPVIANVHSRSKKKSARTIYIIALSSFVLILMCIGGLFVLSKYMKLGRAATPVDPAVTSITKESGARSTLSCSHVSSTSVSLVSSVATCILSVKTFSLAELEKATDNFSSKKILGEGGFGRVYHGTMEDGSEVAVKFLMRQLQNGNREFIAEVEMLSRLHHRNLVKLIGTCTEERARCLVYELVRNGSVESHLHGADKSRGLLDWDTRMKIALGAARGLAYLHEDSNPRVIHRDFKASNILLEDDFSPKVSDFGLAREASEGSRHISTCVMGTFGYVAPEYAMTGHLLVKSDVYSYGVVLLELLSGRKPVDMSQPQGQENLVTWARPLLTSREGLKQLVDPSMGENNNFDNMARVAAIASMCVHYEVSQRPFMGEVVQALKLVCNDADEACHDSCSQKEGSSGPEYDYKDGMDPESNWWNGATPRLTYGYASSFVTMEYCSGPLEEIDKPLCRSSLVGRGFLTMFNRSGPLRTMRHKSSFYRLRGSKSEHGFL